jgi:hypothetical protein
LLWLLNGCDPVSRQNKICSARGTFGTGGSSLWQGSPRIDNSTSLGGNSGMTDGLPLALSVVGFLYLDNGANPDSPARNSFPQHGAIQRSKNATERASSAAYCHGRRGSGRFEAIEVDHES